jgi:hypothetical protein
MAVNSNIGMVFSMQPEQYPHDATTEELLREVFSAQSLPRCYKQDKSRVYAVHVEVL